MKNPVLSLPCPVYVGTIRPGRRGIAWELAGFRATLGMARLQLVGRERFMDHALSENSIVAAVKDQVSCDLDGESAILNIKNGVYYSLDPVGARIWNLLQQPKSVRDIRETLLAEYEVEPQRCENDLFALLEGLLSEGLIEVRNGATA